MDELTLIQSMAAKVKKAFLKGLKLNNVYVIERGVLIIGRVELKKKKQKKTLHSSAETKTTT